MFFTILLIGEVDFLFRGHLPTPLVYLRKQQGKNVIVDGALQSKSYDILIQNIVSEMRS